MTTASQAEGRGFDPLHPLHKKINRLVQIYGKEMIVELSAHDFPLQQA